MFKHVVSFKLKEDKKDMIDAAKQQLEALAAIPELKSIEVGVDVFKNTRSFDFVMIAEFESLDDYKTYDSHELHIPVRDFIHDIIADAVAVDYSC